MLAARGAKFDSLQVLSVAPDSPAAEAGLAVGDRILAWSGTDEPLSLLALRRRLASPGERLELAIERAGARRTVRLVTRERI